MNSIQNFEEPYFVCICLKRHWNNGNSWLLRAEIFLDKPPDRGLTRLTQTWKYLIKQLPSINKFSWSVCLFVSLYPINGSTDQAQTLCEPRVAPGKVDEWSKFQKFASNKFSKYTNFFYEIHELFLFLFYNVI